jgi:hypothetical protein
MRRTVGFALLALAAAMATAVAAPATVRAATSLDINLHVGNPPPPPRFVFEDEPDVVLIPQTRVYYVPGPRFDLFRYGRYWYINNGGWWYRAYHYRGPFTYIQYDRVPVTILRVPPKYHRHPLGGPPGHTGYRPGRGYDPDRGGRVDRGDRGDRGDRHEGKPEKREWNRKR